MADGFVRAFDAPVIVVPRVGDLETPHSGTVAQDEAGRLVFTEGAAPDWQLLRLRHPAFRGGVELTLSFKLPPGRSLYVNDVGGKHVAVLGEEDCTARDDGYLVARIAYDSSHESVTFGLCTDEFQYAGDQTLVIDAVRVVANPQPHSPLTLLDVGAAGGIQEKWRAHLPDLDVTFVEPCPVAASALRRAGDVPSFRVMEVALSDVSGSATLHLTRLPACSSLFRPLSTTYTVAPAFMPTSTRTVECRRFDELGLATPDALKIDAQGAELAILRGFGDSLARVLGIELEARVYRLYDGEPLLHDIIAHLDRLGFRLRRLEPSPNFDGDVVEMDAYFTRRLDGLDAEDAPMKMALIESAWGLVRPNGGQVVVGHLQSTS